MTEPKRQFIPRNDNVPGYIYVMEAVGYHGVFPGCYLRRCKIGLSRNPQTRLAQFQENQPPCDIRILRTIYVQEMERIETALHRQFKHANVKLARSREWFDLSPYDYFRLQYALSQFEQSRHPLPLGAISRVRLPAKLIAILVTAVVVIAGIATFNAGVNQRREPLPRKVLIQKVR